MVEFPREDAHDFEVMLQEYLALVLPHLSEFSVSIGSYSTTTNDHVLHADLSATIKLDVWISASGAEDMFLIPTQVLAVVTDPEFTSVTQGVFPSYPLLGNRDDFFVEHGTNEGFSEDRSKRWTLMVSTARIP